MNPPDPTPGATGDAAAPATPAQGLPGATALPEPVDPNALHTRALIGGIGQLQALISDLHRIGHRNRAARMQRALNTVTASINALARPLVPEG